MKKTIFTLAVDNYASEITDLTFPLLKRYASKIGADFYTIFERRYPSYPVVYEKFQLYDLAKSIKSDWNIYIDADALVNPDMFDPTTTLHKDTVSFVNKDFAPTRWRYDNYFLRDGRHVGAGNWFVVFSDWCLDLWHPLEPGDITVQEAIENITPTVKESSMPSHIRPEHLLDDYLTSRNIARYGLKHTTLWEMYDKHKINYMQIMMHSHYHTIDEKIVLIERTKKEWGIK